MQKNLPNLTFEKKLWRKGYTVIGIDEVGRGAFAGPLVVGAVIFNKLKVKNSKLKIEDIGINDSKKLSAQRREELAKIIKKEALFYATATVGVNTINRVGIGRATQIAMRKAVATIRKRLGGKKLFVLADAFYIKYIRGVGLKHQKAIVHGDEISLSIAAASIIAKVRRDAYMKRIARKFGRYGFERHVGYGTVEHRNLISKFGVTEIHRVAFIRKWRSLEDSHS